MPHLVIPVNEKDHFLGPLQAPTNLVEYGDYQCLTCKRAFSIMKQFQKELDPHLCFVFRHFPLKESHPQALLAATAAEAAGLQNQFWEMHDALYQLQAQLSPESILEIAQKLPLDLATFQKDWENPQLAEKIQGSFITGVRSGVNGTPCFFINGERYDGDLSLEPFKQTLIQAAKNKA